MSKKTMLKKFWVSFIIAFGLFLISSNLLAGNSAVRFNEIMAGLNGDSSIQFIEMVGQSGNELGWGPVKNGDPGRAMLVFYNSNGAETSRFVIPNNPLGSVDNPNTIGNESLTVLFATKAFAELNNSNVDFIIPPLLHANSGKVCFKNNPDNTQDVIDLCLSYGGTDFSGDPEAADSANSATLSILNSSSLARKIVSNASIDTSTYGDKNHLNSDFSLSTPTPSSTQSAKNNSGASLGYVDNELSESIVPVSLSIVEQGQNLFFKETFNGNGRTCETCHKIDEKFGLTAKKIETLPTDDPLFINEQNVNIITVISNTPQSTQEMAKPSDFLVGDVITGSLGGSAKVLAVETVLTPAFQKQYFVINGRSLNIPDNVISDSAGNTGRLMSFVEGNLSGPNPVNGSPNGLEISAFSRGARGLILENIDGFANREVLRGSPSLMNLKFTAPYGLSGELFDLQSFSNGAIMQHFPRNLNRKSGVDFRVATSEELNAISAFQNSLISVSDGNFDDQNLFERFVTTDLQRKGRDLFFGVCSRCHSGTVLAGAGEFSPGPSFNTGVANLPINQQDGLPTEEAIGAPTNSRAFSVPSLFDLEFTAPFFHDNSISTLKEAIAFYNSDAFAQSSSGSRILEVGIPENVEAIEAFLLALSEPPPIEIAPKSLDFFSTSIGTSKKLTATVKNKSTETLKIISHRFSGKDNSEFSLKNSKNIVGTVLPDGIKKIEVVYSPKSVGDKTAVLELNAILGTRPIVLNLVLSGSQGKPEVNIAVGELNFGNQNINELQHLSQAIEVRNQHTAGASLKVRDFIIVGDDADQFKMLPGFNTGFPIRPGDSTFFALSFEPTSLGQKKAKVVITTNDPKKPKREVELTGNVLNGPITTASINVNVNNIDLGSQDVNAGQVSFQNIEIKNESIARADLVIKDLSIVGPDSAHFVILEKPVEKLTLSPGQSMFLTVSFNPSSLGNKKASLRIISNDPKHKTLKISLKGNAINQKLTSILLSPSSLTVEVNTFGTFTPIGTFSDGTVRDISFSRTSFVELVIANPELASSFGGGGFFAFAPGVTTVTAKVSEIESEAATLTILPPPPILHFDISPSVMSAETGQFAFFNAIGLLGDGSTRDVSSRLTWSSSDPTVGRVEFGGVIFALSKGVTSITAVSESGVKENAPATLTVTDPPAIVEFEIVPISLDIPLRTSVFYSAIGLLEDGSQRDVTQRVSWSSSDANVATFENGNIAVAVGVGVTMIIAVADNGVKATAPATLTVSPVSPIVSFDITPGSVELPSGGFGLFFSAFGLLEDGSQQDVTRRVIWSSSDVNVAIIDKDGLAITVGVGTTKISAVSIDNGIKANSEATLTVTAGGIIAPVQ